MPHFNYRTILVDLKKFEDVEVVSLKVVATDGTYAYFGSKVTFTENLFSWIGGSYKNHPIMKTLVAKQS